MTPRNRIDPAQLPDTSPGRILADRRPRADRGWPNPQPPPCEQPMTLGWILVLVAAAFATVYGTYCLMEFIERIARWAA